MSAKPVVKTEPNIQLQVERAIVPIQFMVGIFLSIIMTTTFNIPKELVVINEYLVRSNAVAGQVTDKDLKKLP